MILNKIASNKEVINTTVTGRIVEEVVDCWITEYKSIPFCLHIIISTSPLFTIRDPGDIYLITPKGTRLITLVFSEPLEKVFSRIQGQELIDNLEGIPLSQYVLWYNQYIETIKD